MLLHEAKRLEEAHATHSEALAAAREAGNRRYEAIIAFNRAEVCMDLGHPGEAEEDYRLALTAAREAGDRPTDAGGPAPAREAAEGALTARGGGGGAAGRRWRFSRRWGRRRRAVTREALAEFG